MLKEQICVCSKSFKSWENPVSQTNYVVNRHETVLFARKICLKICFSQNGDTALHISTAMGRRKLTKILLEAGCNATISNKVINNFLRQTYQTFLLMKHRSLFFIVFCCSAARRNSYGHRTSQIVY